MGLVRLTVLHVLPFYVRKYCMFLIFMFNFFSSEIFVEGVRGNVLGTENVRKWFLVAFTKLFHIVCSAIKQVRIYEDSCSSGSGKMKRTRILNTALGCTDHCCGADIIFMYRRRVLRTFQRGVNFLFVLCTGR